MSETYPCPACARRVESYHESLYRAPWVEPCGHTLSASEAAEIHRELARRRAEREDALRQIAPDTYTAEDF